MEKATKMDIFSQPLCPDDKEPLTFDSEEDLWWCEECFKNFELSEYIKKSLELIEIARKGGD